MDTSILGTLFDIAPDLMEEIELRTLVLERVAALGPIGRKGAEPKSDPPQPSRSGSACFQPISWFSPAYSR